MTLLNQFKERWISGKYILPEARVLLAVSGGADSMALAHLFLHAGIAFGVAHCNFGLRGEEADKDEQLVREWCAVHSIEFHSVKFDTKQKSLEWKKATQETARILRYEWFELIRKQHGYAKIVTAHHANDNVETLLINLFKGTGITGLHGIQPQNGDIIRPLLFATREMISAYVSANNIAYREDASNASDDYLRNAVRHKIIPAAEELFSGMITNVNETITRLGQAEELYKKAVAQERKKLLEQRGQDYYIPIRKFRLRTPLETICYELVREFGFSAAQVPHILQLMDAESGRYVSSASHRVIRNRDFLVITTAPAVTADMILVEAVPCIVDTGKYKYSFSVQPKPKVISADPDEAVLDMKDMQFPLVLRAWRTGDYFYPFGMGMKKKKVSRLLIDAKVSLHEKEDVRILECNRRIAWVSGMRIDERFKVSPATENVLVVKRIRTADA